MPRRVLTLTKLNFMVTPFKWERVDIPAIRVVQSTPSDINPAFFREQGIECGSLLKLQRPAEEITVKETQDDVLRLLEEALQ